MNDTTINGVGGICSRMTLAYERVAHRSAWRSWRGSIDLVRISSFEFLYLSFKPPRS